MPKVVILDVVKHLLHRPGRSKAKNRSPACRNLCRISPAVQGPGSELGGRGDSRGYSRGAGRKALFEFQADLRSPAVQLPVKAVIDCVFQLSSDIRHGRHQILTAGVLADQFPVPGAVLP